MLSFLLRWWERFLFLLICCVLLLCTEFDDRRRGTNDLNKQMKTWTTRSVLIFQNKVQYVEWGTCSLNAVWLVCRFSVPGEVFQQVYLMQKDLFTCRWCGGSLPASVPGIKKTQHGIFTSTTQERWHKSMPQLLQMTLQLSLHFRRFWKLIYLD